MSLQHGFVGHHFQEGARLVEIVDLLLELIKCLPVLQSFRELTAPVGVDTVQPLNSLLTHP